jgi:aspartyl-tRNA(Asn)/glutamyl-tRNA(Gln) amidotransferase subunit A
VDLLIGPTTPTPAFAIGAKSRRSGHHVPERHLHHRRESRGLPGISLPCGFVDGCRWACRLIGPHFSEARLLNAAHQFQRATDWHPEDPGGYE